MVLVKEKLIIDDPIRIMQLLSDATYGEHSLLVYPDLDTFRDVYTHYIKTRLQANSDIMVLLPHYESLSSAKMHLRELELDIDALAESESLLIIDSAQIFFEKGGFSAFANRMEQLVREKSKNGAFIFADMGSFFHRGEVANLLQWERSIPAHSDLRYCLICCYHEKDLNRLSEEQKNMLCEHHHHDLRIKSLTQNSDQ